MVRLHVGGGRVHGGRVDMLELMVRLMMIRVGAMVVVVVLLMLMMAAAAARAGARAVGGSSGGRARAGAKLNTGLHGMPSRQMPTIVHHAGLGVAVATHGCERPPLQRIGVETRRAWGGGQEEEGGWWPWRRWRRQRLQWWWW